MAQKDICITTVRYENNMQQNIVKHFMVAANCSKKM